MVTLNATIIQVTFSFVIAASCYSMLREGGLFFRFSSEKYVTVLNVRSRGSAADLGHVDGSVVSYNLPTLSYLEIKTLLSKCRNISFSTIIC